MNASLVFPMSKHSDLIDTVVCTLFSTASILGAVWLYLAQDRIWAPPF